MLISSLQNTRVKNVIRLNNRRQRDEQKRTLVEGVRECRRALEAGIIPLEAFICPELLAGDESVEVVARLQILNQAGAPALFEVTLPVFSKIAYRGSSGGILLVIPYQEPTLDKVLAVEDPFLVVVDGAEKPGNVGAILRTADAAGVDGLIMCGSDEGGTDIHNPNVIRASLGAIFTVPVISMSMPEAARRLRKEGIKIVAATPQAAEIYTAVPLTGPIAVVMGSEALGLGEDWLDTADLQIRIPMFGVVDSLNLSVSTALLVYEVIRQRNMI